MSHFNISVEKGKRDLEFEYICVQIIN